MVRAFLIVQVAVFGTAALTHFGVFLQGYRHQEAGIAESVIAIVLLAGLAMTWVVPKWARRVSIGVQTFALLGTLVGAFTIAIGVGPQSSLDIGVHVVMLALLVAGLVTALRRPAT